MKASAVSTITKSLPIALPVLVNCSLLATLGYFNLFVKKKTQPVCHVFFIMNQVFTTLLRRGLF